MNGYVHFFRGCFILSSKRFTVKKNVCVVQVNRSFSFSIIRVHSYLSSGGFRSLPMNDVIL